MKRIALVTVIGIGLLALPSSASAQSGATKCPAGVHVSASYICVYEPRFGAGGEAVIDPSRSYINAWETNPVTPGYAGFDTGGGAGSGNACDGIDDGFGANTGGCFWVTGAPQAVNEALQNPVTAILICGNVNGDDPNNSPRDGCSFPGDWCCSSRAVTSERTQVDERNGRGRD